MLRSYIATPFIMLSLLTVFKGCDIRVSSGNNDSRPNIILILVDDLGKEWVSCYGAEDIVTPNVDALIDFSDLFPTLIDLAGVEPVKEWKAGTKSYTIDRYSFKDALIKGSDHSYRSGNIN